KHAVDHNERRQHVQAVEQKANSTDQAARERGRRRRCALEQAHVVEQQQSQDEQAVGRHVRQRLAGERLECWRRRREERRPSSDESCKLALLTATPPTTLAHRSGVSQKQPSLYRGRVNRGSGELAPSRSPVPRLTTTNANAPAAPTARVAPPMPSEGSRNGLA